MAICDLATQSAPDSSAIRGGDIINCSYSGTYKVVTLPQGTYVLEVWGAQGGTGESSNSGGYGGYAKGTLNLSTATTLYLYVGQQGLAYNNAMEATAFGGGGAQEYSADYDSGGGGGGSDIRISTSLYGRIIVAGGGGGGAGASASGYPGAAGGGATGGIISKTNGEIISMTAASQTTFGTTTSSTYTELNGAFGVGGTYQGRGTQSGGGGGGGWYGGAAGSYGQGGGGGSGYVYTANTASNYPSGCLLNSNYYLTSTSMSSGQRAGDGYVTITVSSTANDWAYTTTPISAPTYDKQTTSSITLTQNACKCYSFTPTISGPLIMYGTSTGDNYGYLCSSAPTLDINGHPAASQMLISDDDSACFYGGTQNASFGFVYKVIAGTTYYLYIKPFNNNTASQTMTVTYWMGHPEIRMFIKTNNTTWKQITA